MPSKTRIHLKRTWQQDAHYTAYCGVTHLRLSEVVASPARYAAHTTCRYCAPLPPLCPTCCEAFHATQQTDCK